MTDWPRCALVRLTPLSLKPLCGAVGAALRPRESLSRDESFPKKRASRSLENAINSTRDLQFIQIGPNNLLVEDNYFFSKKRRLHKKRHHGRHPKISRSRLLFCSFSLTGTQCFISTTLSVPRRSAESTSSQVARLPAEEASEYNNINQYI